MNFKALACRIAKITKQELRSIDSENEENEEVNLERKTLDLVDTLKTASLKYSNDPLEVETNYKTEREGKKCYMTIRLPRDLKINKTRGDFDLKAKYLDLRDDIWGHIHGSCVLYENEKGLKIYRLNPTHEHDDDEMTGYYYKFVISLKPIKGLSFVNKGFQGLERK